MISALAQWARLEAWRLAAVYGVLLVLLMLWPYDFTCVVCRNDVKWVPQGEGIAFASHGILRSISPPAALGRRIAAANRFSVETWAAAAAPDRTGPARIVSYSWDPFHRNFTIGQDNSDLVVRVRMDKHDPNGMAEEMHIPGVFATGGMRHIVMMYDGASRCVYVDGEQRECLPAPGASLASWNISYPLLFGNERTGDRPWLGRLARVAVFDRALTLSEVRDRYRAGIGAKESGGPVALFTFAEGAGRVAHDTGGLRPAADMQLPRTFINDANLPFKLEARAESDFFENLLLFFPLGLLLGVGFLSRTASSYRAFAASLFVAAITCGVLELLQMFVAGRTSSLFDLASGVVGAVSGGVIAVAIRPRMANTPVSSG